jgi:hypothetical protein
MELIARKFLSRCLEVFVLKFDSCLYLNGCAQLMHHGNDDKQVFYTVGNSSRLYESS